MIYLFHKCDIISVPSIREAYIICIADIIALAISYVTTGTYIIEKRQVSAETCRFSGRSGGIRTRGLMDPNHARYQTSPHPDNHDIIMNYSPIVKSKQGDFGNIRIGMFP